jgi:hypothetical protein
VLGFLRFNTYPASVFMGDAGSQLLGFAIGVSEHSRHAKPVEPGQRRDPDPAAGAADSRHA